MGNKAVKFSRSDWLKIGQQMGFLRVSEYRHVFEEGTDRILFPEVKSKCEEALELMNNVPLSSKKLRGTQVMKELLTCISNATETLVEFEGTLELIREYGVRIDAGEEFNPFTGEPYGVRIDAGEDFDPFTGEPM